MGLRPWSSATNYKRYKNLKLFVQSQTQALKADRVSLEERRTLSYFRYFFSTRIESVNKRVKLHSSGIQGTSYGKESSTLQNSGMAMKHVLNNNTLVIQERRVARLNRF